ncbi:uncharacterized protein LOC117812306 [Notolabrus celidotus]|uniref:uncharacterized protein LOC117812306 n=1 Tax=Notolabrus celidotus TaxID=1203425 RepID=UPI00148FACE6|nr:uncharacterized protein LOC117812306 [Notolabrus celidotus]
MQRSGLLMTAFVDFPRMKIAKFNVYPLIAPLTELYWDEVVSRKHTKHSLNALVDLCQFIVELTCKHVLDSIHPIVLEWHMKAGRIFSHVKPLECFFGVRESEILYKLKQFINQDFAHALGCRYEIDCKSFDRFLCIAAREVTNRINCTIDAIVGTRALENFPMCLKCNSISSVTLISMIDLLTETLQCCIEEYQCNQCRSQKQVHIHSSPELKQDKKKPKHIVILHNLCDVTYSTLDENVFDILTEISLRFRVDENHRFGLFIDPHNEWWDLPSFDSSNSDWREDETESVTSDQSGSDSGTDAGASSKFSDEDAGDESGMKNSSTLPEQDMGKHRLVVMLLTGLLLKTTKKAKKSLLMAHFGRIIKNLSDKAMEEIRFSDVVMGSNPDAIKEAIKVLYRDLRKKFDSPEKLLRAMESEDPTTSDVVVGALKTCMYTHVPERKRNPVVRFFKSLGKAIARPFRECFGH